MMNAPLSVSRGASVAGAFCACVAAGCPGATGCPGAGCFCWGGASGCITLAGAGCAESTALDARTVRTNRRSNKLRMVFLSNDFLSYDFLSNGYSCLDGFSPREFCKAAFSVSSSCDFFFSHFHTPNGPCRSNRTLSPSSVTLMPAAESAAVSFAPVSPALLFQARHPERSLAVDPLLALRIRVVVIAVRCLRRAAGIAIGLEASAALGVAAGFLRPGGLPPEARPRKVQLRKTVS